MKIMFYADWPLATTYLGPLYRYIKEREPTWTLFFVGDLGENDKKYPKGSKSASADFVITCDELSSAPNTGKKICIFHGLASKAQAYSFARQNAFKNYPGYFSVPSEFYRKKLLDLGVKDEKIFIAGLTKFDGLKKNILYAPTQNHDLSAIPVIGDKIYEIPNVKVHLHQWTRIGVKPTHKEFRSNYSQHENREDILDLLEWADVVIGDLGSICLEAVALGKQAIQVVNPNYKRFYLEQKGITEEEMYSLPEFAINQKYATQVHSFEELKEALSTVANIGNASEIIYNKIKNGELK